MEENKHLTKIIVTIPTAVVIVWGAICYELGKGKGRKKAAEAYADGFNDGATLMRKINKLEKTVTEKVKEEK